MLTCPDCSGSLHVVRERSVVQRAWAWFNEGPPVWRRELACDRCDFTATDRSLTAFRRPSRGGAVIVRWRRFQLSRSRMPAPRFYVLLAGVGGLLGAGMQRVGGPR